MCTSHDVSDNTDSDDPRSGYRLAEGWPHYPEDMQFEMGSGVAVDAAGVIYLFTRDVEHWAAHPLAMKDKMGQSSISMFQGRVSTSANGGHRRSAASRLAPTRSTSRKTACSGPPTGTATR